MFVVGEMVVITSLFVGSCVGYSEGLFVEESFVIDEGYIDGLNVGNVVGELLGEMSDGVFVVDIDGIPVDDGDNELLLIFEGSVVGSSEGLVVGEMDEGLIVEGFRLLGAMVVKGIVVGADVGI